MFLVFSSPSFWRYQPYVYIYICIYMYTCFGACVHSIDRSVNSAVKDAFVRRWTVTVGSTLEGRLWHTLPRILQQRWVERRSGSRERSLPTLVGYFEPIVFKLLVSFFIFRTLFMCLSGVQVSCDTLWCSGAHKINNAIGQALLAKRIGKKRIIAETGALRARTRVCAYTRTHTFILTYKI
jgi:hypothetical protein